MPSFEKFDKHHCPKEDADLVLKSKQKKIVGVFEKKFKIKHTQAVLEKVLTDIELPLDDLDWITAGADGDTNQPQYPSPPASYVCLSQTVGLPDCLKKNDKAIARVNYACLENLRVVTADGYNVPIQFRAWPTDNEAEADLPTGFVYVYSLALNAFEGGLGVKGIQSKIEGSADAEDPNEDANEKLRLAQNFSKLGCFCIDVPYEVTARLLNGTDQSLTGAHIFVDLRLGIRAKPKEFERLKHEPSSVSYGSSKFDGKKCGSWQDKPVCANPCCPANPCGKLVPKECGDELILARGQTRKLAHVCVRASGSVPVTTTVDLPLTLCQCCKGKLLTNAWCLTAQIVRTEGANVPPPSPFEQIRLIYDGQEDEQILTQFPDVDGDDETFQAPTRILSVGKGVQAILRKITDSNLSSDAELGQLQLAKQFDDFVFAVDCAKTPQLVITTTPQTDSPAPAVANFDVDILYSFRFATKVELDDGHRSLSHEH